MFFGRIPEAEHQNLIKTSRATPRTEHSRREGALDLPGGSVAHGWSLADDAPSFCKLQVTESLKPLIHNDSSSKATLLSFLKPPNRMSAVLVVQTRLLRSSLVNRLEFTDQGRGSPSDPSSAPNPVTLALVSCHRCPTLSKSPLTATGAFWSCAWIAIL